jgi:hypothetical protein
VSAPSDRNRCPRNHAPTNRIRSFTRWPEDRKQRIEAAKVELGVVEFFDRLAVMQGLTGTDERVGAIPEIYLRRGNIAHDILCDMNATAEELRERE